MFCFQHKKRIIVTFISEFEPCEFISPNLDFSLLNCKFMSHKSEFNHAILHFINNYLF